MATSDGRGRRGGGEADALTAGEWFPPSACLGKHVADMQLRVLLEEMVKRFRRVERVAEPKRRVSNFSAGYDGVLVRIEDLS